MCSVTIDSVDRLIKFVIPLFVDEFDIVDSSYGAVSFFLYGGCLELAKVVKHYYPDTKYAISKDYNHICSLDNDKLYDALDFYEDWQLKKYNIINDKRVSDFIVLKDDEIEKMPVNYGVINYVNGVELSKAIINMIDGIESIKIKKKILN